MMKKFLVLVVLCLSYQVTNAQLSGNYTIGGTTPDYPTIAAAVSDLQTLGVSGPVTFKLRNGTYFEQIDFTLWPGMGSANVVTFESESGDSSLVTWEYWGSNNSSVPMYLDSVNYLKFRNLTFGTASSGNFRKCAKVYGCHEVYFENCRFLGTNYGNNDDEDILDIRVCEDIYISNCRFQGGYSPIHVIDNYSGIKLGHTQVTHCQFYDFRNSGVFAEYFLDLTVTDSEFFHDGTRAVRGIEMDEGIGTITILRNVMNFRVTDNGIGTNAGIRSTWAGYESGSIIANNYFDLKGNASITGGILLTDNPSDTSFLDFIYNTVRCDGMDGFDYPALNVSGVKTRVLNNILTSIGSPEILSITSAEIIDHNILYTGGLQDWTQLLPSIGPNNFSTNPLFVGPNDFHVVPTLSANGAMPLTSVTDDLDGDPRDPTNPDIGADEYQSFNNDAMITDIISPLNDVSYCGTVDSIKVILSNVGSTPLTTAQVNLEINGVLVNTINWSGNLSEGSSEIVNLGTFPYQGGINYQFVVYPTLPNGVTDDMPLNDTVQMSDFFIGLSGVYTIGGTSPDFTTFKDFELAITKGGMCGPVVVNVRDGVYQENLRLISIVGSSAINTLTIQGESGDSSLVRIVEDYPTDVNSTVYIRDMEYITIRDMTIDNDGTTNNRVLYLIEVHDVNLQSLRIFGNSCGGCSTQTISGITISDIDSNLVINNVDCVTAGTSLLIFGNDLLGTDAQNVTITNSRFSKFDIYDLHNVYLADNEMGSRTNTFNACGIVGVERCKFNSGVAFWGGGSGGFFRNNTMFVWEPSGPSITFDFALLLNTGNWEVYHNTFICKDVARSIDFGSYGNQVHNNIFYRDNGSVSGTVIPYFIPFAPSVSQVESDNNLFWVENTNGQDPLGYLQSYYGLDSNSIFVDPAFLTHPDSIFFPTNPIVDNTGNPNWYINEDYYGNSRGALADLGAIEQSFAPNVNLGADTIVCGAISIGGINQGYDYQWNTGDTTSSISVVTSGTYILSVTNPLGSDTDTIDVFVNPAPNVTIADTVWHCYGDSITLDINQAGLTFDWSNGDTDSVAVYTGTQAASVEVTNGFGCSSIEPFEVVGLDSIELQFNASDELCFGQNNGSIDLQAVNTEGNTSISWVHTSDTSAILDSLAPGTYYATITDGMGCVRLDSVEIGIGNNYPVISLSDTTYHCYGDSALVSFSQPTLSYQWSNGSSGQFDYIIGDQPIQVIATNNFGCSDTASSMVLSRPEIQYSTAVSPETCSGLNNGTATVTIIDGFLPIDISWNTLMSDSTFVDSLAPATYNFVLTDASGCQVQDAITILGGTDLSPVIASPSLGCVNSTITFNGTTSGTTQDWYVDNTFISSGAALDQDFGTIGLHTIEMIVSDGVCEDSTTVQIEIGGANTGNIDVITCNSTYSWIDGNTYTNSTTATHTLVNVYGCDSVVTLNLTMNVPTSGIDTVSACDSYVWIDGNTYTSSNTTAQEILTNSLGCDSVVTLNLTLNSSNSGTDFVSACNSYTWIDGNTYTSPNSTATYVIQNMHGCDSVVTLNLSMNYADAAVLEASPSFYANPAADSYQWLDCQNGYAPIPGETNQSFTAIVDGEYAVVVEQNGCLDTSECFLVDNASLYNLKDFGWSLAPNPTTEMVNIEFDKSLDAMVYVTNALGQQVGKYNFTATEFVQIALGSKPGVYFVKINSEGREAVVPVIKL